jgi:UPF0271 protein
MAARDPGLAAIFVSAVKDTDEHLVLFGLSGSHLISAGRNAGLRVVNEVFADRSYVDDGTLTPRHDAGALITDVDSAVAHSMQMVIEGTVTSINGKIIGMEAETICIHGDGVHAVALAKALHDRLRKEGFTIKGGFGFS